MINNSLMNVKDFFKGKTLFLSGTTGFVGKVVLEKILRSLSDIKRIYIMVRPKKSVTIQERLEKEILSSEIFSFYLTENIEMKKALLEKMKPVAGDLVMDKLGLSVEDRSELVNELDVIINCAASVNFDDPLLDAI